MYSYSKILKISTPIMIGSAVQNLITLTDLIFLGRVGEVELGAIGIVGVFYLIITSIGYGFSKGGQIMIARRYGEGNLHKIGRATYSLLAFEVFLSVIIFTVVMFGGPLLFDMTVQDPEIRAACDEYLYYRIFGVFFSYIGVTLVALYTGVARTKPIIYFSIGLFVVNSILNYGLIFGHFGMPEMGMGGAALASTLAEVLAFIVFLIYLAYDYRSLGTYGFFDRKEARIDLPMIKTQLSIAVPILIQTIVGLGSWYIFFVIVENYIGPRELAISNVLRAVYLVIMIPCWGLSSGINTIVSQLIGEGKMNQVLPVIGKTAMLSFIITAVLAVLLAIFPDFILQLGTDNQALITDTSKMIWVLVIAMLVYAVSAVYFNGLAGTGATDAGLGLQVVSVIMYLIYVYVTIILLQGNIIVAWSSEVFYWVFLLLFSILYLRTSRWQKTEV